MVEQDNKKFGTQKCPNCEQFGMSIAESNPNITGFVKHE